MKRQKSEEDKNNYKKMKKKEKKNKYVLNHDVPIDIDFKDRPRVSIGG